MRLRPAALALLALVPLVQAKPMPEEHFLKLKLRFLEVARELKKIEDPAVRAAKLARELADTRDPSQFGNLLQLAGDHPCPPMEELLLAHLDDENAAHRRDALRALARIGTAASIPRLEKAAAEDPVTMDFQGGCIVDHAHVRDEAASTLVKIRARLAAAPAAPPAPPDPGEPAGWIGTPPAAP